MFSLIGVFDKISGLIMGNPEMPNNEGADFTLDQLLLEIIGERNYPVISNFDCSHTIPMHSIGERSLVELKATKEDVSFTLLDSFVE